MIHRIRKAMDEKDEGFTLIELLVVVIIIGILAAIAIPVFLNQRNNAKRATVESDLRNAAIAIEAYYTTNGAYPVDGAAANVIGYRLSAPNTQATYDLNGNAWCVAVNSNDAAVGIYRVTSAVSDPTAGDCP